MKITKLFIINIIFFLFSVKFLSASDFENWKIDFKKKALAEGISIKTLNRVIDNSRFLPDVIKYDRYQPEFYEDTYTYISKRTSQKKVAKGRNLYNSNQKLIEIVSNEFLVDKNLLLALMGIETNFGTYLGKMDIVSSLATLSFDKRRSKFKRSRNTKFHDFSEGRGETKRWRRYDAKGCKMMQNDAKWCKMKKNYAKVCKSMQ